MLPINSTGCILVLQLFLLLQQLDQFHLANGEADSAKSKGAPPCETNCTETPRWNCDVVCKPGDLYLANPGDCGSFYQCSNGRPIYQPCPHGLIFNPDLNVCDRPEAAPHCEPTCKE